MPELPGGTVTFVFTDIEDSTELLKRLGDDYREVLTAHRRIVRDTFTACDGIEIDTQGDAFFFVFPRARDAVAAAVEAQRAHAAESWPGEVDVRVRIGLHTGEPTVHEEGYVGLDVVRAARICTVGRGGQILLSETTRALLGSGLPEGVSVFPLGQRHLRGIDEPERVFEIAIDGLDVEPTEVAAAARTREPAGRARARTGHRATLRRSRRATRSRDPGSRAALAGGQGRRCHERVGGRRHRGAHGVARRRHRRSRAGRACEEGHSTELVSVTIDGSLEGIDWVRTKADLAADDWDNGRNPEALRRSFEQSQHVAIARDRDRVVGMARLLTDGVCNSFIVDVWTETPYRRQGIASAMMRRLLDQVPGQHVGLQTDSAPELYRSLGFAPQPEFWSVVVGSWLDNEANRESA